ncbi:hypothetical protein HG530_001715 [Fusarium avenaceum]|nr:hypothetical protein HG530_001715 [Fusarium avenaceum]
MVELQAQRLSQFDQLRHYPLNRLARSQAVTRNAKKLPLSLARSKVHLPPHLLNTLVQRPRIATVDLRQRLPRNFGGGSRFPVEAYLSKDLLRLPDQLKAWVVSHEAGEVLGAVDCLLDLAGDTCCAVVEPVEIHLGRVVATGTLDGQRGEVVDLSDIRRGIEKFGVSPVFLLFVPIRSGSILRTRAVLGSVVVVHQKECANKRDTKQLMGVERNAVRKATSFHEVFQLVGEDDTSSPAGINVKPRADSVRDLAYLVERIESPVHCTSRSRCDQ